MGKPQQMCSCEFCNSPPEGVRADSEHLSRIIYNLAFANVCFLQLQ